MYSLAALAKNPLYAAKSGVGVNVVRPLEVRNSSPASVHTVRTTTARPWYYVVSF